MILEEHIVSFFLFFRSQSDEKLTDSTLIVKGFSFTAPSRSWAFSHVRQCSRKVSFHGSLSGSFHVRRYAINELHDRVPLRNVNRKMLIRWTLPRRKLLTRWRSSESRFSTKQKSMSPFAQYFLEGHLSNKISLFQMWSLFMNSQIVVSPNNVFNTLSLYFWILK